MYWRTRMVTLRRAAHAPQVSTRHTLIPPSPHRLPLTPSLSLSLPNSLPPSPSPFLPLFIPPAPSLSLAISPPSPFSFSIVNCPSYLSFLPFLSVLPHTSHPLSLHSYPTSFLPPYRVPPSHSSLSSPSPHCSSIYSSAPLLAAFCLPAHIDAHMTSRF